MSMPKFRLLSPIFHDPRTASVFRPGDVLPLDVWQRIGGKATVVPITEAAPEEADPAKADQPAPPFTVTANEQQISYHGEGIQIACALGDEPAMVKIALDAAPRILERMDYQRMQQENRVEVARDTLRDAIMGDDDAERDHAADVIEDLAAWLNAVTDEAYPDADEPKPAEAQEAAPAALTGIFPDTLAPAYLKAVQEAISTGCSIITVEYAHGDGLTFGNYR